MHGPDEDEAKSYIFNLKQQDNKVLESLQVLAATLPHFPLKNLERVTAAPKPG